MEVTQQKFAEIVRNNKDRLRHLCSVYTDRREDEKDLFQEILIQLWRSLTSFNGEAKLSTWAYRLAINTAISYNRKKKTRKKYRAQYRKDQQNVNRNFEPSRNREKPKVKKLYSAISTLNASEKAIIMMYLEDFSYQEIAFVMDISENYVGVKLHRIKKKLSTKIEEDHGSE